MRGHDYKLIVVVSSVAIYLGFSLFLIAYMQDKLNVEKTILVTLGLFFGLIATTAVSAVMVHQ